MTISVLQVSPDFSDSSGASTIPLASITPAASSYLHAFFTWSNSATATMNTVTSVPSLTWTILDQVVDATDNQRCAHAVSSVTSNVAYAITGNLSASSGDRGGVTKEIGGSSGYDSAALAHNAQLQATPGLVADAVTSNATPTLTSQPALISGGSMCDGSGGSLPAHGTGFATDGTSYMFGLALLESKRVTATTGAAATFTAAVNTSHITMVAAFLETGGGGGGGGAGPLRGYQEDVPVAYYVDPGWAALYGQEQQGIPLANRDNVAAPTIVSAAFSSTAAAAVQGVGASTNSGDISETATATVVGVPNAIAAAVITSAGAATVLGVSNNSGTIVSGDGFIAATATALGVGASRNAADISAAGVATPLGVGASVASGVITEAAVATVQGVGAGGNIIVSADGSISASASVQGVGASTAAGAFSCAAAATVKGVPRSNARRIFGGSIHERKARIRAEIEEEEILELAALLVPLMSPGGALCLR